MARHAVGRRMTYMKLSCDVSKVHREAEVHHITSQCSDCCSWLLPAAGRCLPRTWGWSRQ